MKLFEDIVDNIDIKDNEISASKLVAGEDDSEFSKCNCLTDSNDIDDGEIYITATLPDILRFSKEQIEKNIDWLINTIKEIMEYMIPEIESFSEPVCWTVYKDCAVGKLQINNDSFLGTGWQNIEFKVKYNFSTPYRLFAFLMNIVRLIEKIKYDPKERFFVNFTFVKNKKLTIYNLRDGNQLKELFDKKEKRAGRLSDMYLRELMETAFFFSKPSIELADEVAEFYNYPIRKAVTQIILHAYINSAKNYKVIRNFKKFGKFDSTNIDKHFRSMANMSVGILKYDFLENEKVKYDDTSDRAKTLVPEENTEETSFVYVGMTHVNTISLTAVEYICTTMENNRPIYNYVIMNSRWIKEYNIEDSVNEFLNELLKGIGGAELTQKGIDEINQNLEEFFKLKHT